MRRRRHSSAQHKSSDARLPPRRTVNGCPSPLSAALRFSFAFTGVIRSAAPAPSQAHPRLIAFPLQQAPSIRDSVSL